MPRAISTKAELAFDRDLAQGMKRARLASGLTQREAAKRAELHQSSIGRIESGEIDPTLPTLETLVLIYRANLNIGPDGTMLTWMEEPTKGEE